MSLVLYFCSASEQLTEKNVLLFRSSTHRVFVVQVAVVDLNKACGEECKAQLDAEFGEGNCTFISCDVSNGDALRGNTEWS